MAAVSNRNLTVLKDCAEKTRTATQALMLSNVSVHLAPLAIRIFNVSVSINNFIQFQLFVLIFNLKNVKSSFFNKRYLTNTEMEL